MKKNYLSLLLFVFGSMLFLTSCHEASVDITYELVCSQDLLDYATPMVTYTKDNGKTESFMISENEWKEVKETESSYSSTIVIDGDTTSVSNKQLKWVKKVSHDDFSVVNEDMRITYIPKPVANGVFVLVNNFYHVLSAKIKIEDEDGNKHIIQDNRNVTNIHIGKQQMTDIINDLEDYVSIQAESSGKCTIYYNK